MSTTPELPEHWEILNFPNTLEIHDKQTGKTVHAVYKGGMIIGGPTADLSPREGDESDFDLRARLIREALEKVRRG